MNEDQESSSKAPFKAGGAAVLSASGEVTKGGRRKDEVGEIEGPPQ